MHAVLPHRRRAEIHAKEGRGLHTVHDHAGGGPGTCPHRATTGSISGTRRAGRGRCYLSDKRLSSEPLHVLRVDIPGEQAERADGHAVERRPGTFNLLDPTFNAWSNSVVGAVDNGDIVAFALTPQGRTDLPYIFYGIVTDVQPDITNRTLTLVCNDFLQRYEGIKSDKIIFNSYRDNLLLNYALTTQAGWYALTGITDPNIALPFVSVEFSAR